MGGSPPEVTQWQPWDLNSQTCGSRGQALARAGEQDRPSRGSTQPPCEASGKTEVWAGSGSCFQPHRDPRACPRGPFPRARGLWALQEVAGLGQAALICFTSPGCLWRRRPPPPATRGWVSSPALGNISSPPRGCWPGAGPHFLQPGPCPAPWPQPLGTGHEGPPSPARPPHGGASLQFLCKSRASPAPRRACALAVPAAPSPPPSSVPAHCPSSRSLPSPPPTGLPDLPGSSSSHPRHPLAPQFNSSSLVLLSEIFWFILFLFFFFFLFILFPMNCLPSPWDRNHTCPPPVAPVPGTLLEHRRCPINVS